MPLKIKGRRIEVMAFEQERVIVRQSSPSLRCPVCHANSELLTAEQAARLLQVETKHVLGWLAQGRVHGIKTPDGEDRVCGSSLIC
jgi:hypothetical protein